MRVALDTNVLVAAVATRGLCADLLHLILAEHQLVLSQTVQQELRRVLRTKLRLSADLIKEYEGLLEGHAVIAAAGTPEPLGGLDTADARVLADAVAGEADVLVTGDADLLAVATKARIPVVAPRGLWDLLRRDS